MAKSGRLELGDNIYGHYRSIFNYPTTVVHLARKVNKFCEKRKIRSITPFTVIQGLYQSKARMQLPISDFLVTDNLSRTVAELSQLIVQILGTLRF